MARCLGNVGRRKHSRSPEYALIIYLQLLKCTLIKQHHHPGRQQHQTQSTLDSSITMTSSIMFMPVVALLLLDGLVAPASATRHVLQHALSFPASNASSTSPAGSSTGSSAATLAPSQLSQPYSSQAYAGTSNFTFLQGHTTNVTGKPGTLQYAVQLVNASTGANMSAWHDVPLDLTVAADGSVTFNMLAEIPAGDQAKYETMSSKGSNPIMQDELDIKDANGNVTGQQPRYYMYGPSRGNYGGLPQTWSNSNVSDAVTGFPGDNDPLDVLDISSTRAPIGGVYRVKLLGALGMVDANESDWKVLVINTADPLAAAYSDIGDVPQERLIDILEFYANYKQAEKKPAACFWPAAAPAVTATSSPTLPASNATAGAATLSAPACSLPASAVAKPTDYYHSRDAALKVIQRHQQDYEWLLAGHCCSQECQDLWTPARTSL
ncbi:inorganic pyrophosphatase [Scenedesmus sp. NREL 46B-D3]|nr:inorganic pyrophosphatase [Scenedesmus sp. NREL 46B-D3]